jgi:hypothetical protein
VWGAKRRLAQTVILRESGVSSTPRLLGSNIGVSEYWIARFRGRRRPGVFPRRDAPELCLNDPPKEGAALPQEGSGECRVPDAPAAARGG